MAEKVPKQQVQKALDWLNKYTAEIQYNGTSFTEEKLQTQIRHYEALKRIIKEHEYDFVGVKCHYEMSRHYCTECIAAAFCNDPYDWDGKKEPIVYACEADSDAALTMQILKLLTGQSVIFMDVRHYDKENDVMVFCNCGSQSTYYATGTDDYYALGMSYVLEDSDTKSMRLFREYVDELKADLIGEELMAQYGEWPAYAKLYDYDKPLFHHLHLNEENANKIGLHGKPEAYYFLPQYNSNYLGRFPLTYFGFDPSTTKEEVMQCLKDYDVKDNRITELSRAYRIKLGTGWYTPAGVIHAPASVVTYEPQWNSDVNTIMENVTMGEVNPHHLLTDCAPDAEKEDLEAVFAQIDWEESTRTDYKEKYYRAPKNKKITEAAAEKWVSYANDWIAAKEVTILPGQEYLLVDQACYCALVSQGHGSFGRYECEAPELIRYGDLTGDEFFVSEMSAKKGIVVKNKSTYQPLVMLQNFANNNPEVPKSV